MLLISESGDKSTDQVIDWLFFYCSNLEFIRTNVDCDFKKILVNIGKKQPNVTENKYEIVSKEVLEELMQGYFTEKEPLKIEYSYNKNGIAYIPNMGYFDKNKDLT